MSDSAEPQRADGVLRELEERFRRLVEVMPVAVYVCDRSGIIQNYNTRAVELWGREPTLGDPAQRHCGSLRLYSPDGTLVPHEQSKMAEVLRTGIEARDLEVVIERPDGSRITVLVNIVPLRNDDGELIGAMNCFQDITDRKRAEEGLRRSERLLRLVLDALPVGVAVVDRSGDIILSNPASQRIWGGSIRSGRERYAESKGWWHATGQRLAPEEWASARAVVNGETSVNEVLEIEAFDGVRKIIQNSAVPIRDANERITGAVVVNEDISARETAERELNDSYNQMRTLTGRLMRAQDDERRRIAQMLHETTAQDLAGLKMLLARLNRTAEPSQRQRTERPHREHVARRAVDDRNPDAVLPASSAISRRDGSVVGAAVVRRRALPSAAASKWISTCPRVSSGCRSTPRRRSFGSFRSR